VRRPVELGSEGRRALRTARASDDFEAPPAATAMEASTAMRRILELRSSMCRIEGGDSFPKTVVTEQLAHKVHCSENAAFPAESRAGITQSV
jgi:hypothetical protein